MIPGAPYAHFDPTVFAVGSLQDAIGATVGDLILLSGKRVPAMERWVEETRYTIDFVVDNLAISVGSRVLDYGCGTGRISRGLIDRRGCSVIGIEASTSMAEVSRQYVDSTLFSVHCGGGPSIRCDYAVCLWVLQHCESPKEDIGRIFRSLAPGGELLVFNENIRYVPTVEYGFANDGVDVRSDLKSIFGQPVSSGHLDPRRVSREFSERSFWAIYRRPLDL